MKRVMLLLVSFVFLSGCLCNKAHFCKENMATQEEEMKNVQENLVEVAEEPKFEPEPEPEPEKETIIEEEYKEKFVMSVSKVKEEMENGEAYFAFGSSDLTKTGKETIKEYSNELNRIGYEQIMVEGHTDSIGKDDYNQKLSEARAETVKKELEKNGIDGTKIKFVGYGKTRPIADNKTKEGRSQNRRVEIKVK